MRPLTTGLWAPIILTPGLAASATASSFEHASGTVEIDLVFPRNETYAPGPLFPIVLGFQNPALTPFLHSAYVDVVIFNPDPALNFTERLDSERQFTFDLQWANFANSTLRNDDGAASFEYKVSRTLDAPGTWALNWQLVWTTCWDETGRGVVQNTTVVDGPPVVFTLGAGGRAVNETFGDSVNDCEGGAAVALRIEDTAQPRGSAWERTGGACPVLQRDAEGEATPCRAGMNESLTEALVAAVTASACRWDDHFVPDGVHCGDEEDGGAKVVVGSAALLGTLTGAVLLML